MSISPNSSRRTARSRRGGTGSAARTVLTVTAALLLTAIPAQFAAAADPTPASGTGAVQPPAESETAKAIRSALQQAKATGKPIRIDSMTNETTEVFADTDGRTLYSDARSQDVRTKRNGSWQTLDSTLKANPDGTVTPALTGSDLVLSGGGSGPLAKITTADGTSMSITAPFPLPKPTLDGATATYGSVLPDVDLQVTARPDGGWRDVIVVKTAAAAADPRLKSLHFPLSTSGLKVGADAAGNVSFKDAAGKVRFHAPTPFQWDSGTAPAPAPQVKPNTAQPKSLFAAPGAAEAGAEADTSNAARPGASAAVSAIGVAAGDTELVLTPDPATFGKGTGPWYLDPETSVDNGRQVNAQVQENHPDTANVNTLSALGVGYCGYDNCTGYGRYRSYYQMSTPDGLFDGNGHGAATVNRATLFVDVVDASAPTNKSTINVYSAPAFQGTTTWNNQPCGTNGKMTGCTWVANADTTGTSQLAYDVKGWMQTIVNNKSPNWTIGFSAEDEYDKLLRHHLTANPHITTYYDIAPTIWWPRTTPTPGYINDPTFGTQRNDCQTPGANYAWYAPGWVGANQFVYLNASAWSPIGATTTVNFHIWDDNDSSWHAWPSSGGAGSYGSATASVDRLTDGHQYGWTAVAADGQLTSGNTPACYLRVDKTPPQVAVSSADYPASGQLNQAPTKKVGQPGTFTVNASDPAPANGLNASGVACVRWSTDPTAVTGWSCNDAATAGSGIVSGTSFTFTPTVWGTNILYVQGMDVAGNYSQPMRYTFYVPWDPAKGTASPGDLTGDGRGDILLPDEQGNLRVASLDSDAGSSLAAPLDLFPGGVGWKDSTTKITHRGALRSMQLDDTFARSTANTDLAKNLYLFENNGDGTFKSASPLAKPSSWAAPDGTPLTGAPAGWVSDWSAARQILALGPLNGPVNASDSLVMKNQTALLTVENGSLWLYRGDTTNTLDAPAIKVSSLNWDNYELINPGTASGTAQPTLWTRDKTDGTIRAYDIKLTNGRIDLSALADPAGPLSRVVGTQKFAPDTYAKIGSSGDANKDGIPDLWTIGLDGKLRVWPAVTVDGTKATAVNGFGGTAADQGDAGSFGERYRLQGLDANTLVPGYYKTSPAARPIGNVSFPTDAVNGISTKVAAFAGNSSLGRIDFSGLVGPFQVDTAKSFSITAWAKPSGATAQGAVLSSRGTNSSGFVLAPGADGNWHFKLATADGAQAAYDDTSSSMTNAARFKDGRWDRLTVSYNSTTKVMSLYVNGALAGTAVHSGGFAVKGQLEIGANQEAAAFSTAFSGRISDVTVFNTSTDAGSGNGPLLLDTASNSCVDDPGSLNQVGQLLQIYTCDGRNAQKYDAQPDGTLKVFTHCIEGVNNGTVNGTNIQLADCTGAPNQQWIFRPDGSIYNVLAQRCLDVPNANTNNGTLLELYDCNQTTAQRWRTTPVA
ncbi:ricin-type beta-trefoil lectin domain protein [Streptomyces sp. TLI_171]|uniref:ricin-type beta-trefoil lectin domain protein n=1 Tax=Streptomyces sp. TLI_171 TaxID=1938859 RepID=UPI000C1A3419|nr:ricin-type beta-trefoil lectin domain protein [Streptomyces sp. TLI_171]RKE18303.1 concanavalin A-like lectin/glucanase superfamily protein [Streptomyces sp. TLI_171]